MFEHMEIYEYMYEGIVETSHLKKLGHLPTVLVTVGYKEEKLPHQILTLR